ncbi:MAG TPA: hypothetical protein GX707_02830 [Epulopiscium sp.]|nr:hypothetical protein [Candidatus Epulonipiscium sp.]
MIEFFTFSWEARIYITVLLGLCVLAQTLALLLNFYRNRLNLRQVFKNLLEVFILCEILIFSFLHGQIIHGYKNGFVVPTGYENIRVFVFLVILILVIIICIVKKTLLPVSVMLVTIISLPIIENILRPVFPWFFIGGLIFFLGRSIRICISSVIAIGANISALSVIHAIDTLYTGVLFSENDGHTLLSNQQMQKLMIAITGKIFRNALQFYNILISDQYESRYKKVELDGQIIYLLNDGTAWMFTKTDVLLGIKNYIHISAADVTQLWRLTAKLQLQNQELKNKSDELKETMANLHTLSKKKEIENAKMRAHDILGQRLTVLLRIIQNEHMIDYDLLTSLSKGLLAELKAEQNERRPYDKLKSIQQIFAAIGVDIKFEGQLPSSSQQAHLFIDIIREASTNAVRHAFATQINIRANRIENTYHLTIKNNGHIAATPIIPGSGIKVMRKKATDQGGNLNIIQKPLFTLFVTIPGGD